MAWETVIGLEVHTQLKTQSKLFSASATTFGASPNEQASVIDLGLPGVLPTFNQQALHLAIRFGLGINASINDKSIFERKNYFYPDLPKGYQITQFEHPIVIGGHIDIKMADHTEKRIRVTRAHLEEDAGKSTHDGLVGETSVDFNRAGIPLLEIVSEPDLRSAEEAVTYLKTLHQLVRYLDICDGNMEQGSFRCDVNLSMRQQGDNTLGTRTEMKNLNSFRFIEQAILYERDRQIDLLESGKKIRQETRLYDPNKNITKTMRVKEDSDDYRYFPDPDLLPVIVNTTMIDNIKTTVPELPATKKQRYMEELQLSADDTDKLISHLNTANYFEHTLQYMTQPNPQMAANWINGELSALLNREKTHIADCPIKPDRLAGLLSAIQDGSISNTIGREVQNHMWQHPETATDIIQQQGLTQISDNASLEPIINDIISKFPQQAADFRAGKDKLFAFFVGQVMKQTKGKANPQQVNQLLKEKLK